MREAASVVVAVLVLTWLLQTFVGRQYIVPSESMESTLHGCAGCTNDRIVIDKLSYTLGEAPRPGEVVVFKAPTQSWDENWTSPRSRNTFARGAQDVLSWFGFAPPDENDLVKRVVATAGQTVECHRATGTGVTVDGTPLHEPYIDAELQREDASTEQPGTPDPCHGADFGPITVPARSLWVMGDNRAHSADSRYHIEDQLQGTVPVSAVRGKVVAIIWPVSRWSTVATPNPQH